MSERGSDAGDASAQGRLGVVATREHTLRSCGPLPAGDRPA